MSIYKPPGSTMWWVSLSHPDHPRIRRSTGTADRTEAQRIHDRWKADLWRTAPIKGHTWGDAVIAWATKEARSKSDLQSLAKFGKHYPDRALSKVGVDDLYKALSFCKTPATYMRYRARLAAILNVAKSLKWLVDVPELPVKRVTAKPRMWLTPAQWEKLRAELPPHQQRMAAFSLETGLRQSNVLQLRWSQVDLERQHVWVEASAAKGKKAIAVPLNERALRVLHACKDQHPEFVFTYAGHPVQEIKTAFQAVCVRAGLGSFRSGAYEGFTWHGLRHTWATWHMQAGTPEAVLQALGAWTDPRMVKNYAHHSTSHLAQFADNRKGDMNEPIVEVVAERHIKVYLDGRVRGLGTANNITVVNRAKPLIDSLVADIKWLLDSQLSTDPRRRLSTDPRRRLIEERIRQLT